MLLLWLIHLRTGNAAIVDAGWGAGLAIIGILDASLGGGYWLRCAILGLMTAIWGFRSVRLPPHHPHHRASGGGPLPGIAAPVENEYSVQISAVL